MYQAIFSNHFLKKEKKLKKEMRKRVIIAVKKILNEPYVGIPLVGDLMGVWKYRVGKYRLLYEIDEKDNNLSFHTIDLRKKVYK